MSNLEDYFDKLKEIINQDKPAAELAEKLEGLAFSKDTEELLRANLSLNDETTINYVREFTFDWSEEVYDDEDSFTNAGIQRLKDLLADIDEHNLYHPVFRVKSIYSKHLKNDEWDSIEIWQDIDAATLEDAKKQTDAIRKSSPKELPDKPGMTLFDVILKMEVVDSAGKGKYATNIEPAYGAYFEKPITQ